MKVVSVNDVCVSMTSTVCLEYWVENSEVYYMLGGTFYFDQFTLSFTGKGRSSDGMDTWSYIYHTLHSESI